MTSPTITAIEQQVFAAIQDALNRWAPGLNLPVAVVEAEIEQLVNALAANADAALKSGAVTTAAATIGSQLGTAAGEAIGTAIGGALGSSLGANVGAALGVVIGTDLGAAFTSIAERFLGA